LATLPVAERRRFFTAAGDQSLQAPGREAATFAIARIDIDVLFNSIC